MNKGDEASRKAFWGNADDTEARERYRTLVQAVDDGIYRLDPEERFVAVNDAIVERTGYAREELLGSHASVLFGEDGVSVIEREIERLRTAATDRSEPLELTVETASGESVDWELRVTPLVEDDTVAGSVGIAREVTGRRRREREQELEQYERIVETVDDGVYVLDEEGRFTMMNEACAELVGYDRETLLGSHVSLVVDEDVQRRAQRMEAELLEEERDEAVIEAELETADGDRVTSEVTFAMLPGDDERWHQVGIVRDITERKRAQQRLEEERDMFAEGPAVVFRWRNEDGWPVEYVSDNAEDVLGYAPEELESGDVQYTELLLDEELDRIVREVERNSDGTTERFTHDPYRIETKDGDIRWVKDVTKVIRDEGGDITHYLGYLVDITERKERERKLERSERRYRTLAQNFPDGAVGIYDHDLRYDVVEGGMWDDIEPSPEDLEGNTIHEAFSEDITDDIEPIFRAAVEEGQTDNVITEFAGRTLRVWATPLRDSSGEIFAGLSFANDITERVEREAELERARDLLDRTQRIADVGGWEIDVDTQDVFWTDYVFELLEVDTEEEPPLDEALEMFHEEDQPLVEAAVDDALDTGEPFDIEVRNRTGSGEIRWLRLQGVPETSDGEVVSLRGAAQDVTERREREEELRQQRERLTALDNLNEIVRDINRALVRQSTREEMEQTVCERLAESDSYEFAWVGVVDEETGEIIPSTHANTQGYLEELTVTTDESPTGRGPSGTAARTRETKVVRDIQECSRFEPWRERATERDINASASIPIGDESRFYGLLNVYTARENAFGEEEREVVGQLGEIMGLAITAIEHEQRLQHQREQLAFINSLLRHNLLNDLNIVHARAGIVEPHVDTEGREHLEVIRTHADEMATLIDTLRSFTEALVEDEHELSPVDVGEVLRAETEKTASGFEAATFDTAADLDTVPAVMADELLGEVFRNLLVNAVQHNDSDAPRVTIDAVWDEEQVTVEIADNGPGIPEEMKDRLFEKGEKRKHSRGTGYGLHLVDEIIDLYDGDITAENTETGAVFSVTLPRA